MQSHALFCSEELSEVSVDRSVQPIRLFPKFFEKIGKAIKSREEKVRARMALRRVSKVVSGTLREVLKEEYDKELGIEMRRNRRISEKEALLNIEKDFLDDGYRNAFLSRVIDVFQRRLNRMGQDITEFNRSLSTHTRLRSTDWTTKEREIFQQLLPNLKYDTSFFAKSLNQMRRFYFHILKLHYYLQKGKIDFLDRYKREVILGTRVVPFTMAITALAALNHWTGFGGNAQITGFALMSSIGSMVTAIGVPYLGYGAYALAINGRRNLHEWSWHRYLRENHLNEVSDYVNTLRESDRIEIMEKLQSFTQINRTLSEISREIEVTQGELPYLDAVAWQAGIGNVIGNLTSRFMLLSFRNVDNPLHDVSTWRKNWKELGEQPQIGSRDREFLQASVDRLNQQLDQLGKTETMVRFALGILSPLSKRKINYQDTSEVFGHEVNFGPVSKIEIELTEQVTQTLLQGLLQYQVAIRQARNSTENLIKASNGSTLSDFNNKVDKMIEIEEALQIQSEIEFINND